MKTIDIKQVGNTLQVFGDVYLNRKHYAEKYKISQPSLTYDIHKKRVDVLDILGAKFIKDAPPIRVRFKVG